MRFAIWKRRRESLEGPLDYLRLLATTRILAGEAPQEGPFRVVVQSRIGEPGLSDADRELLWRAFQLPVYEALYDTGGKLAAMECEAHDGLHPAAGRDVRWFGKEFQVERGECACGQVGDRIRLCARPRQSAAPRPALLTEAGAAV